MAIAILAVPRSRSVAPAPAAALRIDPGEVLGNFWRTFEVEAEGISIDDFDRWVEGVWEDPAGPAAALVGQGAVTREGAARRLTLDGPGFAGRAELTVQPRLWAVTEYALVAEDLSCVLCHVHIDGTVGPARAFSGAIPTEHRGKQVSITGGLVAGSGKVLFDDARVDLRALRLASGTLSGPRGRVVPIGAAASPLLLPDERAKVSLRDQVSGHLELAGTEAQPIEVNGNLIIEGDLLLRGAYRGDGVLFVDGNAFLPGGLQALDQSSLTLVVLGSVLVGDAFRPRYDESLAITGDPDGSFGFLLECLARFNAARGDRLPLGLLPGQGAYRLSGRRATGDWYDPALKRLNAKGASVGPALLGGGEPWFDLESLREPVGTAHGSTLDATVLTPSAFIAVASGLRTVRERPSSNPNQINGGAVPPGAMLVRGSIAASHAAIHAPSGLRIIDSPVPRSVLSPAFNGGLDASIESIDADGSTHRSMGTGAAIPGGSVMEAGPRDRLRAPSAIRPAPGR